MFLLVFNNLLLICIYAFHHSRALTFKWFFIFGFFFSLTSLWFLFLFRFVFCTLSLHSVRLRLRSRRRPCLWIISANWQHRSFHCTDILFNNIFLQQRTPTRCHFVLFSFFFPVWFVLSVSLFRSLLGWHYFFCAVERWNCAALPGQQCFFYPTVPHIHAQTELLPRGLRLAINSIIILFGV